MLFQSGRIFQDDSAFEDLPAFLKCIAVNFKTVEFSGEGWS